MSHFLIRSVKNMEISKNIEGVKMVFSLSGRLDTVTSPQLEAQASEIPDNITNLKIDITSLEYISSAGLRVLLMLSKKMQNKGSFAICNINDTIKEVFDVTGFSDILTIE